ncbi:SRPBCC domain-containing protein [Alkalicoccobacillus gibsonii]|uniref:SRPBCC domain-containing protein n=1 Tax=Alkalicoccobacillus gibsonii TaxID=79881 RepID=UPI0035158ADB
MTNYQLAKKEILIHSDVEKVWQALTIPEQRNRWETRECNIDLRIGGVIYLDYGWNVTYAGTFTDIIEYKKLVTVDSDGYTTTWLLKSVEQGCLVQIEYTGHWSVDEQYKKDNMLFGTYQFLLNFKTVLEDNQDIRSSFWKSWIGVLNQTEDDRVHVVKVVPDTPAATHLQPNDYLLKINGQCVSHYDRAEQLITHSEVGSEIRLLIERDHQSFEVTLHTIAFGTKLNS